MPTYQYHCRDCHEDIEILQKMTDPTLTVCPLCQGKLRKVFSAVGVVFKGSGFYATDNRTKGASQAAKSAETSGSESSGTASDTAKPAEPAASSAAPTGKTSVTTAATKAPAAT